MKALPIVTGQQSLQQCQALYQLLRKCPCAVPLVLASSAMQPYCSLMVREPKLCYLACVSAMRSACWPLFTSAHAHIRGPACAGRQISKRMLYVLEAYDSCFTGS